MTTTPSPTSPDDGCFWRAIRSDESAKFDDPSKTYGLGPAADSNGLRELLKPGFMTGKKCVRFLYRKKDAIDLAKTFGAGAKVLRVPAANLSRGADFDVWGDDINIIMDGEVARRLGTLHDPDKVP